MRITITLLMILIYSQVKACDCDKERRPVKQLLENSKTVFIGSVISSRATNFRDTTQGITFQEIVLRLDSIITGDPTKKEISIFTERTNCGQFFQVGKKYLVYAYQDSPDGFLKTHLCFSLCPEINTSLAKQDLIEIKKLNAN